MAERKVPRIDYGKYRAGRAAGRREAVTVLGDSLRELGCVRVQGWAEVPLPQLAKGLLAAVEEYFGLTPGALEAAAAELVAAPQTTGAVAGLLLLVPEVPKALPVRVAGETWRAVAHPGELLAFAGEALGALTAGRIAVAGLDGVPPGSWQLGCRATTSVAALPEFDPA